MISGRVIGQFWASKRIGTLPQGALLHVALDGGGHIIALDPLGCGEGEHVLITQGSVAAGYFEHVRAPVDALVIGSLDEQPARD